MSQTAVLLARPNRLVGTTVQPAGTVILVDPSVRDQYVAAGTGQAFDKNPAPDLAAAGFGKNAYVGLTLSGSTPITLDLSALAAAAGVVFTGNPAFASWNHILFTNTGAQPLAVSPGASNPLRTPLGGTAPTHTVNAGDVAHWNSSAGSAVDATHKTVTITPTSGGSMLIAISGS